MQAEIITIGDEILIGQITDTNSKWIAERLNEIGISVFQISSVQDRASHIRAALDEASIRADLIIMTGGLGPTKDDITKKTLASYFEDELVTYPEIEAHIKALFARIKYNFTDKDLEQAMLPSKAVVFKNDIGTASGMWMTKNGKVFVSLPGVPDEMKGLMLGHVLPKLQEEHHLPFILHRTVHTFGLGESRLAHRLEAWEDSLPEEVKLAYLPSYGRVRLRLTAKGEDKEKLERSLALSLERLQPMIQDISAGLDEKETLESMICRNMEMEGLSLSMAESCTGGSIAARISSVPGASKVLKGGLVAYSAAVKIEQLGVSAESIEKHSVVSEVVAREMAEKCKDLFGTDYAIATTGNAGPTRDKTDASVGVVFIGLAGPKGVVVKEFYFGQPRAKVIERATVKALQLLRKEISKNK